MIRRICLRGSLMPPLFPLDTRNSRIRSIPPDGRALLASPRHRAKRGCRGELQQLRHEWRVGPLFNARGQNRRQLEKLRNTRQCQHIVLELTRWVILHEGDQARLVYQRLRRSPWHRSSPPGPSSHMAYTSLRNGWPGTSGRDRLHQARRGRARRDTLVHSTDRRGYRAQSALGRTGVRHLATGQEIGSGLGAAAE
jgi:hypothetical protein